MKTGADLALDRIEVIIADLERLDPERKLGQASDHEAIEIVGRIIRKRRKIDRNWQKLGDVAKKIIDDANPQS